MTDGKKGKVFLMESTGWAKAQRGNLGLTHRSPEW